MRGLVRSEDFSWALLEDPLNKGMKLLDDLADRGVIPGVSIEVLVDRLSLPFASVANRWQWATPTVSAGACICNTSLSSNGTSPLRHNASPAFFTSHASPRRHTTRNATGKGLLGKTDLTARILHREERAPWR